MQQQKSTSEMRRLTHKLRVPVVNPKLIFCALAKLQRAAKSTRSLNMLTIPPLAGSHFPKLPFPIIQSLKMQSLSGEGQLLDKGLVEMLFLGPRELRCQFPASSVASASGDDVWLVEGFAALATRFLARDTLPHLHRFKSCHFHFLA